MNIQIREATAEDLETIQKLNRKLCVKENTEFDSTVNPEFATTACGERYFKKSLENEDGLVLIAEDNNNPIGYLVGRIEEVGGFRNISNMCEVDNMWIDEEYRSQGIGKQLMNEVKKWSIKKGIKKMRVIASYKNKKGIKFYEREGFGAYDLILEKDI